MATTRDRLLRAYRRELGTKESPRGSNKVRYSKAYGLIGPWCHEFISVVAVESGAGDIVPWSAYTPAGAAWFKERGRWHSTPKKGAIVYYEFPGMGRISHVGVVEAVHSDGTITAIEGNAQPLSSKVLTTSGWKLMGAIRVGDEVVDPMGRPSVVTGVFPKGVRRVFRVNFSDGSSVECCDEHLWSVTDEYKPRDGQGKRLKVMDTLELARRCLLGQKLSIPAIQPPEFVQTEPLTVDPYLLGLFLGDGGLTRPTMVRFSSSDAETVKFVDEAMTAMGDELKSIGGCDYRITGSHFLRRLQALGVHGHGALTKRVPEHYLWASAKDRLALLQGLMDSDGSIDKEGRAEFCTVSKGLADDVQHLVQSLGGKVRICLKTGIMYTSPYQSVKTPANDAYVLRNIRFADREMVPFRLARKAERHRTDRAMLRGWSVKSVEYVRDDEVQCISVSAESHLYVTDDFIPTHNTDSSGGRTGGKVMRKRRPRSLVAGYGYPAYISEAHYQAQLKAEAKRAATARAKAQAAAAAAKKKAAAALATKKAKAAAAALAAALAAAAAAAAISTGGVDAQPAPRPSATATATPSPTAKPTAKPTPSSTYTTPAKPVLTRVIAYRPGHRFQSGGDVRRVAALVGCRRVSKGWGPTCDKAVRKWQRAHGLKVDGEFGAKSAKAAGWTWHP